MNKDVEKAIVKSFFVKRLQDRIMFELFSPKRHPDALHRLCHYYRTTLREEYLIEIPKPNSDPEEIAKLLKKNGVGDSCYAISFNDDIDGRQLPLTEALDGAVGHGFPSFILCTPNKLAYFEAEQGFVPPPRFIVKK